MNGRHSLPSGLIPNASGTGYLMYGHRESVLITRAYDGARGGASGWRVVVTASRGAALDRRQYIPLTSSRYLDVVARLAREYLDRPMPRHTFAMPDGIAPASRGLAALPCERCGRPQHVHTLTLDKVTR
jgi:hypothetical protein